MTEQECFAETLYTTTVRIVYDDSGQAILLPKWSERSTRFRKLWTEAALSHKPLIPNMEQMAGLLTWMAVRTYVTLPQKIRMAINDLHAKAVVRPLAISQREGRICAELRDQWSKTYPR